MKDIVKIILISIFLSITLSFNLTDAGKAKNSDEIKIDMLQKIDKKTTKHIIKKQHLIKSMKNDKSKKYDIVIHSSSSLSEIKSTL